MVSTDKTSSAKSTVFWLLLTAITLAVFIAILELGSWYIWTHVLRANDYVKLYGERMASIDRLLVNPETEAIGYEAGTTVVTYNTGEFVDRFPVWFSPELGVGIFDDGIDDTTHRALVIGDSFGRGVGATTLTKNWVETAERQANDTDILNLSFVGSGLAGYIDTYRRYARHFQHDTVILSFDADSDFIDSAYSKNRLVLFQSAEDLKRRAIALNYDEGCNRLQNRWLKSWTLHTVSEVLRRRYEWANVALRDVFTPCPSSTEPPAAILREREIASKEAKLHMQDETNLLNFVSDELRDILTSRDLGKESAEVRYNGFRILARPYHRDRHLADLLTDSIAERLLAFADEVGKLGKCLVIVMHPTKSEVYASKPDDVVTGEVTAADIRYPFDRLKGLLSSDITVIDPTTALHEAAQATQDRLYYAVDMHYTPAGYAVVGNVAGKELASHYARSGCSPE